MTSENPFLGFEGRIGRGTFWVCSAIIISATISLIFMSVFAYIGIRAALGANVDELFAPGKPLPVGLTVWSLLLSLGLAYPTLTYTAKRLHDVNQSGWWGLAVVVPSLGLLILNIFGLIQSNSVASSAVEYTFIVLSLAFIVILGCIPGTPGYNAYGANPIEVDEAPAGVLPQ